jgi:pseudouridine synthase
MRVTKKIRLNKFLSEAGVASRRKSEEMILQGRVQINGKTVTKLAVTVDPDVDRVEYDGSSVKLTRKVYYILNKPKGYVTTTSDEKGRPKVTDLVKGVENLFPVGRLDFNTTGLLILTNDGDFSNSIAHPSFKVERRYSVLLNLPLKEKDKNRLLQGIILDNRKSRFKEILFESLRSTRRVTVVTEEGRNRFVKRMFSSLGYSVKSLERTKFGPFELQGLAPGKYKAIDKSKIDNIKKSVLTHRKT